ncbi:MAG: DUF1828 domain-containing protein [Pirellulaceae bacterium]
MITANIAGNIRRQIGDRVSIEHRDSNDFVVSTPFMFSDGDHYGFAVIRDVNSGQWRFTDEGEVVSKATYAGVDLLAPGRIERTRQAVEFYGLTERDGELSLAIEDGDFGKAFFQFSQACMDISRMTKLSARRSRTAPRGELHTTFERLLRRALPAVQYKQKWHHEDLDPHRIYAVDFQVSGRKSPLLIFTPETDVECLHATIACQHYRQKRLDFEGVAITDDSRSLLERNVIALKDATTTCLAADDEDEVLEFLRSKVA